MRATVEFGGGAIEKKEVFNERRKSKHSRTYYPQNCAVILIDHQPNGLGVSSIDRQVLINNVLGLAKAAKIFNVPTILTTVAAKSFSGELFPEIQEIFPDHVPIDRTSMNSWDDAKFRAAVQKTGRKKLVIAALWTEICFTMPTNRTRKAQLLPANSRT